ncbi:uncharacterized protein LOC125424307 [Ziziphus jujuba]|uniref:Uncharacterized protein LOC125424307 n=1 Tax=Ziziphus jujuba TaxID=326968 RepID=A0ABM3IXE5_ZIZJJ|nr:uncharacterized protein LOC125424307 [Ziziphus jujuba]XP_048337294.2 uncharacterized protein LOC125424307 [Ziziphus jujuba]XP_048337295.2 uncharacterized protein LOC125424307 [Ziziphus jujuba]
MKFEEGSAVEVLRREKDPYGSWFCGNIIAEDGDYYIVRYELLMDDGGEPVIERVHEEEIRPQPPHHQEQKWTIGDIAEAFDKQCWRLGKVAKVLKNNRLVIKFFGSIQLKEFHASDLRIRQAWHENNWSMFVKVPKNKQEAKNCRLNTLEQSGSLECNAQALVKREETCSREQKRQKVLKKGMHNRLGFSNYLRNMKKGRACHPESSSKDLVLERSFKKRTTIPDKGNTTPPVEVEKEMVNKSTDIGTVIQKRRNLWMDNSFQPQYTEDSYQCSVASCNLNPIADDCSRSSDKIMEVICHSSDAESTFPSLSSKKHPSIFPQKLNVDIHELELQAYKSTVQALHASGPLSWEQESMLTNLRLSLHISNEEHLFQLRHLLSAQVL